MVPAILLKSDFDRNIKKNKLEMQGVEPCTSNYAKLSALPLELHPQFLFVF